MATVFRKVSKGCVKCVSRQLMITRGKRINIQRPRPRVWDARVMESITRPIYFQEPGHPSEKCSNLKKRAVDTEVDEFEEFVYKHCKKVFEENRMILVCQKMSMSVTEVRKYRNIIINNGMKLEQYNNKLMRRAVTELPQYENMKPWILGRTIYISSAEPMVKEAIKTLKKLPDFILLGGLVDDHLLSKEGLIEYSKLPNIEQARGQLVSTLNMAAGGKTHSLLESHQQTLCRNLGQYVKQSSEGQDKQSSEGQDKPESEGENS